MKQIAKENQIKSQNKNQIKSQKENQIRNRHKSKSLGQTNHCQKKNQYLHQNLIMTEIWRNQSPPPVVERGPSVRLPWFTGKEDEHVEKYFRELKRLKAIYK